MAATARQAIRARGAIEDNASSGIVLRERLDEAFDDALARQLTLIQAPAGMGKTTVMRRWQHILRERGEPFVAITLDEHSESFLSLFTHSLLRSNPEIGKTVRLNLMTDTGEGAGFRTSERELSAITDALASFERRFCIFVDDVHFLPDQETVLFRRFISRLPANVSTILASRTRPRLPFARLAAIGAFAEVDQQTLRFTREETARLLAAMHHGDISHSEVDGLYERTEGWAAGLRLAVLAMSGRSDRARLIASFSGSQRVVSDFFSDDVVSSQPEDIQRFLDSVCFLDRFTADLCDEVMGRTNSAEILQRAENSGLFLVPLDDEAEWFRFHSLFSDFLRRRSAALHPTQPREIHTKAARWFFARGMISEALAHADQAGDIPMLAEMLDASCLDLVYDGKLESVYALSERIGPEILRTHPNILLSLAWRQIRRKDIETATGTINRAEELILNREGEDRDDGLRSIEHRRIMLAAAQDRFEDVSQRADILLGEQDVLHPYLICNLYGQSIRAKRDLFRFDQFERYEALARRKLNETRYYFAFVAQLAIVGRTYIMQARSSAAEKALVFGLKQAIDFAGERSWMSALPSLPLARLAYEMNDLARARKLLDDSMGAALQYCFSDELLDGYGIAPRLRLAEGDFHGAMDAIDEANSLAAELDLERLKEGIRREHIKILLDGHHVDRAMQLDPAPLAATDTFAPKSNSSVIDGMRAEARIRLDLARSNYGDAVDVAQKWRTFCRQRGAVKHFMSWTLLYAQLVAMTGDRRVAQRALREAMVPGSESGFSRMFLDEGSRVFDLLQEGYAGRPTTDHAVDRFAFLLLDGFRNLGFRRLVEAEEAIELDPAVDGKLTVREIEILSLVAAGLRNREIGDRLGLTEGSVKWYMQQIYDKVGTRRRSLAVERARQFGFLD